MAAADDTAPAVPARQLSITPKLSPEQIAAKSAKNAEYSKRKSAYRFGSRNLQTILPTSGYPTDEEQGADVAGDLQLDFAIGYNGSDSTARNNIRLSKDGNFLIYYIAAVCVVYNLKDGTQQFFFGHNDDVSSLDVNPKKDSTLVASGQVDPKDANGKDMPKIFIWDYTTCQPVFKIDNAAWGSVKKVAFSPASRYLYSLGGDEDQTLRMWDQTQFKGTKDIQPMLDNPTYKEEIFGLAVSPKPNPRGERVGTVDEFLLWGRRKTCWGYIKSAVVKGQTKLYIQYRSCNFTKKCLKKDVKPEGVYLAGAFLTNGQWVVGGPAGDVYVGFETLGLKKVSAAQGFIGDINVLAPGIFVTIASDKMIRRWNHSGALDKVSSVVEDISGASSAVNCPGALFTPRAMAYNMANKTVYIGSKSNQIIQYDMANRQADLLVDGHDGQIWGLASSPDDSVFITGGYDGVLKVWDAATKKVIECYEFDKIVPRKGKPTPELITSAAWSPNDKMIVVGTESSKIALFTWIDRELILQEIKSIPKKSVKAQIEQVSYLRFSPDNQLLAVGHYDSNAYIYTLKAQRLYARVEFVDWKSPLQHTAATTNLQWSTDSKYLKCFTRDYEVCHWGINDFKRVATFCPSIPDPDVTAWADDPLIAGWEVQGCYQDGWDGTDLNDCSITSDGKLVASGDDYGFVRLQNFPSVSNKATKREYQAHSAFVVGIEWLRDDSYLLTCGGNDKAIFGWRLVK